MTNAESVLSKDTFRSENISRHFSLLFEHIPLKKNQKSKIRKTQRRWSLYRREEGLSPGLPLTMASDSTNYTSSKPVPCRCHCTGTDTEQAL